MTRRAFLTGIIGGLVAAVAVIVPQLRPPPEPPPDDAYVASLRKVLRVR